MMLTLTTAKKYAASTTLALSTSLLIPVSKVAAAAAAPAGSSFTIPTPDGSKGVTTTDTVDSTLASIAGAALNPIFTLAGVLAVAYLIYSGILYITAGGNADRTKQARAGIINAIIGIVVLMSAYVIVRFATSIGNTVAKLG